MANPTEVDVLFCTYDVGDSKPLERVMTELKKLNITSKVLAFGKSADIFHQEPGLIKLELPDAKWDREKILSNDQLTFIKNAVEPKIVIVGMASAIQAQILNFFKRERAYTIAFYDNFDAPEGKDYIQAFLKNITKIDEYFLPSATTLSGFQKMKSTKQAKLNVLGQPVLEEWGEIFTKTNKDDLRQKLNVTKQDQIILFVGGCDDTYKEYFRIFVKSMKSFPDKKIMVTYHPKTDGSLEKAVIAEEKAQNIKVIDKGGPSTSEISTIANVLICHKSSVGVQALYMGLPVIYVVKKGDLNNFAINQGLALSVETAQDLTNILSLILSSANRNQAPIKELDIPKNATKNMITRISQILKATKKFKQSKL